MKRKILVYDTSLGYGVYFKKIFKQKYEIETLIDKVSLKKAELFYYDCIIFIINEYDDMNLFLKIHTTKKGIRLFLGITQEIIKKQFQYQKDVHYINLEYTKRDIVKSINQKLELQSA